jgi:hypothetical protein
MNVGLRYGAVTDDTSPSTPEVKLDGETTAAPTPNYAAGYTPVNADRVAVLVSGGDRMVIGVKQ